MTSLDTLLPVTCRIPPARPGALAECVQLESWIEDASFTFVLGPGCARIDATEPVVTAPVAKAMADCFVRLTGADDRAFLVMTAATHGIDLTYGEPGPPSVTWTDTSLLQFRAGLVSLAAATIRAFMKAAAKWAEPVMQWENMAVLISTEDRRRMLIAADDAISAAQVLSRENDRDYDLALGIKSIIRLLEGLKREQEDAAPLSVTMMEWVSNLAWHAFRFNAPWFPSSDEMAFQLGLTSPTSAAEVPDLPLATQTEPDWHRPLVALQRIVELSDAEVRKDERTAPGTLYAEVARLMVEAWQLATSASTAIDRRSDDVDDEDVTTWHGDTAFPHVGGYIAVSTTFDQLLERALEAAVAAAPQITAYHVIAPIYLLGTDASVADFRWAWGTFEHGTVSWDVLRHDPGDLQLAWQVKKRGPIIVKLNGTPDPTLGRLSLERLAWRKVEPAVIISEFQHLTAAYNEFKWLYDFLTAQGLPKSGRLILLGESVGQWSMRQRLFMQSMVSFNRTSRVSKSDRGLGDGGESEPSAPTDPAEAIAINRRVHPLRHSLLPWMSIRQYEGELRDVADQLQGLRVRSRGK